MSTKTTKIHLSAKGEWQDLTLKAHGWSSKDNRAKKWNYWWLTFDAENVTKAGYELFKDGAVVMTRTPLSKSPELFDKTSFEDEEPDEGEPIGGAAKLAAGIYAVDFYLTIQDTEHVLRGVRFEVTERTAEKGGWQIKTPFPNENPTA